jgi:sugar lactone lactonase YvrE
MSILQSKIALGKRFSLLLAPLLLWGCGGSSDSNRASSTFTRQYSFGTGYAASDIAVQSNGDVLLAFSRRSVVRFSNYGKPGGDPSLPTSSLSEEGFEQANAVAYGIAISHQDNSVYLVHTPRDPPDPSIYKVSRFSPTGELLSNMGHPWFSDRSVNLSDIAVDRAGLLYVGETQSYTKPGISVFDSDGKYLRTLTMPLPSPASIPGSNPPVGKVTAVALDSQDNLYAARTDIVSIYSPTREHVRDIRLARTLAATDDLAVDNAGNFYTCSDTAGTIQKFSPSGQLLAELDGFAHGVSAIAVDDQQNVYVSAPLPGLREQIHVYRATD